MKKILFTGASGFIGTNLLESWKGQFEMINLDWNSPLDPSHQAFWRECDIMDKESTFYHFNTFQPDYVIHLAARTDTDIYNLDGDLNEYIQNTVGTQHVLDCIKRCQSIKRVIITSSMFVCKPGYMPQHNKDYSPFTLYGVSKKLTEQYARDADLQIPWCIIRPQTIWGPWSIRYKRTFYKVMKKGIYFHPDKKNVYRSYGFIGNVVWQIRQMLIEDEEKIDGNVFYVGDKAINLLEWVKEVSTQLVDKPVRVIPSALVKGLALTGDILRSFNLPFPITSTRYNSMVQDYLTPIEKTYEVLGPPPYDMITGVEIFTQWLTEYELPESSTPKIKVDLSAGKNTQIKTDLAI